MVVAQNLGGRYTREHVICGIRCVGLSSPHPCEEDVISNFREDERALTVNDRAKMHLETSQDLFNSWSEGENLKR